MYLYKKIKGNLAENIKIKDLYVKPKGFDEIN